MMRFIFLNVMILTYIYALTPHYERLHALKASLAEKGITKERIETIFSSEKARQIDERAVCLIADMSHISKHKKAEQKSNENLLLQTALIKKHLKTYQKSYEAMEKRYGVNREIVAAILQKETALGCYKNYKHDAFVVLNNMLLYLNEVEEPTQRDEKRTARLVAFAQNNLQSLILYYENQGIDVTTQTLASSYAGAMGIPQFTPQHFDMIDSPSWDKNKTLESMPTAIFSTAKLLKERFEFDQMVDFSKLKHLDEVIQMWNDFDDGTANFVYEYNLDGVKVKNFLKEHEENEEIIYIANYIKILKRYNFSTAYALGILQIAQKVH